MTRPTVGSRWAPQTRSAIAVTTTTTNRDCTILQTRYYDAAIGRFINADGFTSTGQGLFGNNMYAYCLNNPISYTDPSGRASQRVFVESQTEGAIIFQESIGNPERIPYKPSKKTAILLVVL